MFKKILTAEQTRAADQYTIVHEPITSIDLMERASMAYVEYLKQHLPLKNHKIVILCGTGNNGGDGLAIARILKQQGFNVDPVLLKHREELSADCMANYKSIKEHVQVVRNIDEFPDLSSYSLIIDAILGTGVNSPLRGLLAEVVQEVNELHKLVYAVDLPTGLYADMLNEDGPVIESTMVISFQGPKFSFFFPENNRFIGDWDLVDIGLDESFIQAQQSNYFFLDEQVKSLVKPRPKYSHKGSYGHALLMAGSKGKMGAAVLCAQASLRSGVGLSSIAVPQCGLDIIQSAVPEAMAVPDVQLDCLSQLPNLSPFAAIGIGPGIGQEKVSLALLKKLFDEATQPIVLDADALNLLASEQELLKQLPPQCILTPHIKEFSRLAGESGNAPERYDKLVRFAQQHNCIVVLKDAHTAIATTEGDLYFNTTGNPGMATGGSGDVLTGIITGLLAQGYSPKEAAIIGVYFHGLAGDRAADIHGKMAMTASDIVNNLYFED